MLYNTNLFQPGLLLVILLGSVGYTAVGTLLSAMSVQTRTRDILLPYPPVPGCHSGIALCRKSEQRVFEWL